MPLGVNHQTTTTHASYIPNPVWSKEITRAFEANLIAANKVSRFDSDVSSYGSSIQIPNLSNLVANDKLSNTAGTLQAPEETHVNLPINKYKHVAFLIEDITAKQSKYNIFSEYTQKAGYALRKQLDTDVLNLVTGFSQAVSSYNSTITAQNLLDANKTLNQNDVPMADRCWLVHPETLSELLAIDNFTKYDATGYAGNIAEGRVGGNSGALKNENGLVGMLYGSPVYMTTQVPKTGNNTSNLYMHKEALALAVQKEVKVETSRENLYQGDLCMATILYGVVERRDNAGVEVKS